MPYPMNIAAGRNAAAGAMMGMPQGFNFGNTNRPRPQGLGFGGGAPPVSPPQFGGMQTMPQLGGLGNFNSLGSGAPSPLPAPPTGPFNNQFNDDMPAWARGFNQRSPAGPAPGWNPMTGISGG